MRITIALALFAGCFAMAGSKTQRKFFSIWADSKSATSKPGDT